MRFFLLTGSLLLGYSAATSTPAFANWWIVRSSDETCLIVDIEPTGNEKGITKIGKESYPTAEEAEADVKRLCKSEGQVERLERVFSLCNEKASGKTCPAIKGILEEGQDDMKDADTPDVLDASMIADAMQQTLDQRI
jgi:uncharacterized protein DUF892